MRQSIEDIKQIILPILLKYETRRAGIFGSVARGDAERGSDVDILVELDKKI